LWFWSVFVFTVLAVLAAARAADWSYGADTGTFVQLIIDTPHGMRDGIEAGTHFRYHWSPTLALLWPLLALTKSLWVLQALLALGTAACGPLLAVIARKWLSPAMADRAGYVALVYPPLVGVGFGEFRDLGLLVPLALAWWLALERRAWVWFGIATVLLAGLREDVCLEMLLIGGGLCVLGVLSGDRPRALAAGLAALAGFISDGIYALVVLPRVGPWPPSHFYEYPFAHGPGALLLAPLLHPLLFIAAIATLGRLTYLLEAFVPLLLLPFRSRALWFALPGFAIVLLANSGLVWRMGMHYAALWIPATLIAFAMGLATLRRPQRWALIALVASAIYNFGPLHPLHYLKPSYHALDDARRAFACVPDGATVATQDEWYTTESARFGPRIDVFTGAVPSAQYIVYADDYPNTDFAAHVLPNIHTLERQGAYRVACRFGAVVTLQRSTPHSLGDST
jgi:uncharacterized membrane protein